MREVAGGCIAAVPVPLAPIVAQRFSPSVAVAGLGVPIYDGEARMPSLSAFLVYSISPSFRKSIGTDKLESKFGIVGQVINSVVRSCIVLTVSDRFKVTSFTVFP